MVDAVRTAFDARPVLATTLAYIASKTTMLVLAFLLLGRPDGFIENVSLRWDGAHYRNIARFDYPEGGAPVAGAYAFPPAFPLAVRLLGSSELAPMLVNNVCGIGAVALIARLQGAKAALFFALFPTWMVYSTTGYSEGMFVLLAAATFLLVKSRQSVAAGWVAAAAALARYVGGFALAAAFVFRFRDRWRQMVLLTVPMMMAGIGVAIWHYQSTGTAFAYFEAQAYWWARLAFPWEQIAWYLNGDYTTQEAVLEKYDPSFWLLRNYAFTAIVAAGTYLLWRARQKELAAYSAVIVLLSLCTVGTPAISAPRLLLAAFPAIACLGGRVRTPWGWTTYAILATLAGTWILIDHLTDFFA